jgi:hypothetical protein
MPEYPEPESHERPYTLCEEHQREWELVFEGLEEKYSKLSTEQRESILIVRALKHAKTCPDCLRALLWKNGVGVCDEHLDELSIKLQGFPEEMNLGEIERFARDFALDHWLSCKGCGDSCMTATTIKVEEDPERDQEIGRLLSELSTALTAAEAYPILPGMRKKTSDDEGN